MQKIVTTFVFFVSWWLIAGTTPPGARADNYCSGDWHCWCSEPDEDTGVCIGNWICECDEAGEDLTCECPPGYVCDRFGECHEMGEGGRGRRVSAGLQFFLYDAGVSSVRNEGLQPALQLFLDGSNKGFGEFKNLPSH